MSRQLRISGLFSALALVGLALFARAGDVGGITVDGQSGSAVSPIQIVSADW